MHLALGLLLVAFLVGCSSTQSPSALNQLQIKVAELEKKVEVREQEIDSLKEEIAVLSGQPTDEDIESYTISTRDDIEEASESSKESLAISGQDNEAIIRVAATVKQIQAALKNAGYYDGEVDGRLGSKSKRAISNFQKDHELTADGIVGKKTWAALKAYLKE